MAQPDESDAVPDPESAGAPVVLASGSPRRKDLLATLGLSFAIEVPDIDESEQPGESARDLVLRLALEKARAVAGTHAGAVVIAADTVLEHQGEILGKPRDLDHAREMLASLAGTEHEVLSGVAVLDVPHGVEHAFVEVSQLRLAALEPAEIESYLATGEPLGKAGAYAIQGDGGRHLTLLSGSYSNVVGLPLERLREVLAECPSLVAGGAGFEPSG